MYPNRRSILGAAAAAISAGAAIPSLVHAQSRAEILKGEKNHSTSNPGPMNKVLAGENLSSEVSPSTDSGDVNAFWYSFELAHRRIQDGGWTRQVTEKDLPSSRDLAGVNMRLTAGSYRELHWHTANEWAYMLYGRARVTVLNPDGTFFIGDVSDGDLWFFPAGYPHSIQGLGPDGCEFLLVFDEGAFSEYQTFLISDWLAHTPVRALARSEGMPVGAVGFEGRFDDEALVPPLFALIATASERARSFSNASKAAAAAQAEMLRSAILDAFAHEFKTPQAIIMAAAGGLRGMGGLRSEQLEMTDVIENHVCRMNRLTTRLLRMARIDHDEVKPNMEVTSLRELVTHLIDQYQSQSGDRLISTELSLQTPDVLMDPELMLQ